VAALSRYDLRSGTRRFSLAAGARLNQTRGLVELEMKDELTGVSSASPAKTPNGKRISSPEPKGC